MADTENVNIFIKTFDGFDVYVNCKMLYFLQQLKAKEILAIHGLKSVEAAYPYPR